MKTKKSLRERGVEETKTSTSSSSSYNSCFPGLTEKALPVRETGQELTFSQAEHVSSRETLGLDKKAPPDSQSPTLESFRDAAAARDIQLFIRKSRGSFIYIGVLSPDNILVMSCFLLRDGLFKGGVEDMDSVGMTELDFGSRAARFFSNEQFSELFFRRC